MKGIAASFVTGIVIIAILFVMVRPGSQGPSFVTAISSGVKGVLGKATGGGTWAKG